MILPINHVADWRYISQRKQAQIDKAVVWGKTTRIDHGYIVGNKVMTRTKSSFKYETPYRVMYKIVQTWTNRTVTLRIGTVTTRINIRNIRPYNTHIVE